MLQLWGWTKRATASAGTRAPGPDADFWYVPTAGTTGAGVRVTPETAIKSQAVFACVSKIAKIMAAMPLKMYREDERGQKADPEHPLDELLHYQPNMNDTAVDFWQQMLWHAVLRGTAYAEIKTSPRKAIAALIPLHPSNVRPERLESGRYRFKVRDPGTGMERILRQEDVFRFAGITANGIEGMGLCDHADEAIAIGMAADQYASRIFSNNLNAGIIITHPGKLSEQGQTNFVAALMNRLSGSSNMHRPLVLQEGMRAEKGFTQTAEDAQLLEARKWQTLEVCRALDMPPIMVGITEGAQGANVEEQSLNFVRYTLQPWAKRIEQAIRRDLIAPEADGRIRHKAEFNFSSLLRGNATARAAYFSAALGSGGSPAWMAVNEVRALDGLNAINDPMFDKPALGTNPKQTPDNATTNPERKKPADEGDEGDEDGEEAADDTAPAESKKPPKAPAKKTADPFETVIAKEVKLLRKYAVQFAGDKPRLLRAISEFYRSHVSFVVKTLGTDKAAARVYCLARIERFKSAGDVVDAIETLAETGVAELKGA